MSSRERALGSMAALIVVELSGLVGIGFEFRLDSVFSAAVTHSDG